MHFKISAVTGFTISATDGDIGTVADLLFDDVSWTVRWLVVDTGTWLSGRKVLLPPSVLGHPDLAARTFPVRLTRAQVEASPGLDGHLPMSRQFETRIYDYYGWSPYWGAGLSFGGYGSPAGLGMGSDPEVERRADDLARRSEATGAPHLRSAAAVTGYHIHATDGAIGHLADFLAEDTSWSIRYLVVETGNWWNGARVLISPQTARHIDWTERKVTLDVDRQTVRAGPPYDPDQPVDRDMARRLARQYPAPSNPPPDPHPAKDPCQ